MKIISDRKIRRKRRVRSKFAQSALPRVSLYRSNKYIYAQVIGEKNLHTITSISTNMKNIDTKETKTQRAKKAGIELAKKMLDLNFKKAILDRGPYKYAGRVAAFATGLREGGITI